MAFPPWITPTTNDADTAEGAGPPWLSPAPTVPTGTTTPTVGVPPWVSQTSPKPRGEAAPQGFPEAFRQAGQIQEQAIARQADAEAGKAQFRGESLASAYSAERDKIAAEDNARREASRESQQKMQELIDDARELSQREIKSEWAEPGTAKNLIGAISAGIGTVLQMSGVTGGRNLALESINQMIERDLQMQRDNLQMKQQGIETQVGLLGRLIDLGNSEAEATAKARAAMQEQVIKGIEAEASQYDSPIIKEQSNQLIGKLRQDQASAVEQYRAQQENEAFGRRMQEAGLSLQRQQLQQRKDEFAEEMKFKREAMKGEADAAQSAALSKFAAEQGERAIFAVRDKDGNPVTSKADKDVVKSVNEKIAAAQTVFTQLERLEEIYQDVGWESAKLGNAKAKAAQSILHDLQVKYAKANGQGAISEGDAERYGLIFGADATGAYDNRARWKALRDSLEETINNELEARAGVKQKWKPRDLRPGGSGPGGAKQGDVPNDKTVTFVSTAHEDALAAAAQASGLGTFQVQQLVKPLFGKPVIPSGQPQWYRKAAQTALDTYNTTKARLDAENVGGEAKAKELGEKRWREQQGAIPAPSGE